MWIHLLTLNLIDGAGGNAPANNVETNTPGFEEFRRKVRQLEQIKRAELEREQRAEEELDKREKTAKKPTINKTVPAASKPKVTINPYAEIFAEAMARKAEQQQSAQMQKMLDDQNQMIAFIEAQRQTVAREIEEADIIFVIMMLSEA